jgi:subtilisin family serine protease
MSDRDMVQQFVLMPKTGLRFRDRSEIQDALSVITKSAPEAVQAPKAVEDERALGPKMIVAHSEAVKRAQDVRPDLRLFPVRHYGMAFVNRAKLAAVQSGTYPITLKVTGAHNGTPIAHAQVAAVADMASGSGVAGTTGPDGSVTLQLSQPSQTFVAFYIVPQMGYWSYLAVNYTPQDGDIIELQPVRLAFEDALSFFYGVSTENTGAGVRIGVIDGGVGPHRELVITGGRNFVTGEDSRDWSDNGLGHGTHVAGILGSRGTPPNGVRGLSPSATLYSYRVFGQNSDSCTNLAVLQAIDQAIEDGCDLINMSLALDDSDDPAVHQALEEVYAAGMSAFAASGNTMFGPRGPVSYPASDPLVLGVSAMGRTGYYPQGTLEVAERDEPFGTDEDNFVARFSNSGASVSFTGPGVGIISTYPGGYAVMDGTSMATPTACGRAAALLAANHGVSSLPRLQARADAMKNLFLNAASPMGFGADFEGHGRIR